MKNRAAFVRGRRIVATSWRQLCNGPLHNWKFLANKEIGWQ
jgi:hypothetical protein